MGVALRAAIDYAPTEVAAEDSASHIQHIFRRAIHAGLADSAEHENGIPFRWREAVKELGERLEQVPP